MALPDVQANVREKGHCTRGLRQYTDASQMFPIEMDNKIDHIQVMFRIFGVHCLGLYADFSWYQFLDARSFFQDFGAFPSE